MSLLPTYSTLSSTAITSPSSLFRPLVMPVWPAGAGAGRANAATVHLQIWARMGQAAGRDVDEEFDDGGERQGLKGDAEGG